MDELILDACLERVRTGRGTVEECVARFPVYADELKPLLKTVAALKNSVQIKPSPEFTRLTRARLLKLPEPVPDLRTRLLKLVVPPRRAL